MTTESGDKITERAIAETPAPRLDDETAGEIVAIVAPYLRAQMIRDGVQAAAEASDLDLVVDARPLEVVDALHAAGVLVFKHSDDRAHLRKMWAAMSTVLYRLAKDEPLTPDVLAGVPVSHRFYLMGHEAAHRQLAATWGRLFHAQSALEDILRRGTAPTPVELGAVLAQMGGTDPYAGGRPVDADPWWGCWTAPGTDAAAFRWERYERTCDPDAPLDGLGDLCAFLGGTWSETPGESSFIGQLLRLIVKAQATPDRFAALERAFPREVTAWRVWMPMSPSPTARELYAELTDDHDPTPPAAADEATLERQINDRAAEYAGAIVVHADGSSEILRQALRPKLLARVQLPEGARPYALPWPAGTRAVYDPVDGVVVEGDVVVSRDLFVSADNGMHRCLLGRVRRLGPHEKRRGHGRRWWECRYCHLGATGAATEDANEAELLGHEAICGDQDHIDASIPRTALTSRPRSAISPGDPDWVTGFGPVPGASLGEDGIR